MKFHSKSYEQYCFILDKNIVLEETLFHNGEKCVRCTNIAACKECKNRLIKNITQKEGLTLNK